MIRNAVLSSEIELNRQPSFTASGDKAQIGFVAEYADGVYFFGSRFTIRELSAMSSENLLSIAFLSL